MNEAKALKVKLSSADPASITAEQQKLLDELRELGEGNVNALSEWKMGKQQRAILIREIAGVNIPNVIATNALRDRFRSERRPIQRHTRK
ncbi:MAG: hypothetical protein K8T91_18460 [Planctomycetes bacterium]|nr:hypothetical protein [Planctomycetota bacterium]